MRKLRILTVLFTLLIACTSVVWADVGRGDRGSEVQYVQRMLVTQGYLVDKADGVFGNNTEYAVRIFQKQKNLPITGKVDSKTLSAIKENNKHFEVSQPSQAASQQSRDVSQQSRNVRSKVEVSRFGDRGRTVSDLQVRLASSGFSPGSVDGIFGQGTADALKRFQQANGLTPTGEADQKTMNLLAKERGIPTEYKKAISMNASAYSADDPGNSAYTARGNLLKRGYVSVDPDVIPLGTAVYVEGYGYAVADDIGGAIVGNRIDLAMDSHGEAINYGRQTVMVYILN
ncbi:MAG: peptidoglycan-binding protein [Veillonella sp.]|uniref:peptidoglycan-binding protein n=1 Tax=Veillonella sp. TaxID=1926307 RepID=UPI0025F84798|nr:peptidoglycan-binding protein [Veillonella sp.]MBS4912540.1 peptidoglycan-binding protein [Veillonella sp.]